MSLRSHEEDGRSLEERLDDLIEEQREVFDGLHE